MNCLPAILPTLEALEAPGHRIRQSTEERLITRTCLGSLLRKELIIGRSEALRGSPRFWVMVTDGDLATPQTGLVLFGIYWP